LRVALLGDIALFGRYSLENLAVFDYFRDVAARLHEFDYVVANLETPLCNNGRPYGAKSAHIRAAEKNVELLKFLNIGIVNLANNHIFDYGLVGYENTKRILEEYGIQYFGIENKQVRIEDGRAKLALSGFCCYSTNGLGYAGPKSGLGVNELNAFEAEKVLLKNHSEGYFNITSFHVGEEHINYPNYDHVRLARILASKVPYVFYGHHPHVMQGIEEVSGSLIAYSLGNFCFDDVYTSKSRTEPLIRQSGENKKSFILALEIKGARAKSYEVVPLFAAEDKLRVTCRAIIDNVQEYSKLLQMDENTYRRRRGDLLSSYLKDRKKKRDVMWYVKRLNINSIRMLLNARRNRGCYSRCVTSYIQTHERSAPEA